MLNTLKQELKPWEKGLPLAQDIIIDCPGSITIVLANRIYIETKTLPQTLLARLRRLASFSNPVFFKTQALRFSTNGIPRFICLANIEQGYLNLPRGCFDDVVKLLDQQSIIIEIEDKRKSGQIIKGIQFKGKERVIVYDYVDQALPMLQRMFKKRSKGYEAMGYSLSFKGADTLIQTKLF